MISQPEEPSPWLNQPEEPSPWLNLAEYPCTMNAHDR